MAVNFDTNMYKTQPVGGSAGDLTNLFQLAQGIGKGIRTKKVDDIIKRRFMDNKVETNAPGTPNVQKNYNVETNAPETPNVQKNYDDRMQLAQQDLMKQYPREGMALQESMEERERKRQEFKATLEGLVTANLKEALDVETVQYQFASSLADTVKMSKPENFEIAFDSFKTALKAIDKDISFDDVKTVEQKKKFLERFPLMAESVINRNKIISDMEDKERQTDLDAERLKFDMEDKKRQTDLNAERLKLDREKLDLEWSKKESELQEDLTTKGKTKFDQEKKLRDEYLKHTADYRDIKNSYDNIASLADSQDIGKGMSDLALVIAYMKLLDPGSVVREGEQQQVRRTGSIPDKIWNQYIYLKDGKSINPNIKQQIKETSKSLFENRKKEFNYYTNKYKKMAQDYGLDFNNITAYMQDEEENGNQPNMPEIEISPEEDEMFDYFLNKANNIKGM